MLYILLMITFLVYSCTPAEIAIAEEITEEAINVEKDLFTPPSPFIKPNSAGIKDEQTAAPAQAKQAKGAHLL